MKMFRRSFISCLHFNKEASRSFFLGSLFAIFVPLALHAQLDYATPYAITTLAGRPPSGDVDGTGIGAQFRAPRSIAIDGAGNVYVADSTSNTIRKITAAGVVTTLAGSTGLAGQADGTGSAARFSGPQGVAVDGGGTVYVADYGNHTIRKISAAGAVTTLAGLAGNYGSIDGTGSAARFQGPQGVAVDSLGNVYVSDGCAVRKITAAGLTTTLAGSASSGGSTDGTGGAARFGVPQGLAVDGAGNVYVADISNHAIRKITASGVVTTLAGLAGSSGSQDGTGSAARFWGPQGVAVDAAGNVYVADTGNQRIRKISSAKVVTTFTDTAGVKSWTSGSGVAVQFASPPSVAVDGSGNIYVADFYNYAIKKISTGGVVTVLAGLTSTAGAADGTGSAAQFNGPSGIAVDSSGNAFVADEANSTVRKITPAGVTTTFAGMAGIMGLADGPGSSARFVSPRSVGIDGAGNIYVADSGSALIRKITPAGVVSTLAALGGGLQYMAVDGPGNVYVILGHAIKKVSAAGVVTAFAGASDSPGSNDGLGVNARFSSPLGLATDAAGNVYVSDTTNHTIRKITPAGVVTTLAGTAGVYGLDDGLGSSARFAIPTALAVDGLGNLYVADGGLYMIRKITAGGKVTSLAGGGGSAAGGAWGSLDGTGGNNVQFTIIRGIAADSAGNIWISDFNNNIIRRGVLAPPGLTSAVGGEGTVGEAFSYAALFSGEPTSYGASGLPTGLHINGSTGVISGTPTTAGSFGVTLSATNTVGTGTATFTLTIAKGYQYIFFGPVADRIYGDAPFSITATVNSGLNPTYNVVSGPATISGSTVTLSGAGMVTIRGSQPGNANYNAAPSVEQSFTVAKIAGTVALSNFHTIFNGSPQAATATTNPASLAVAFTYNGSSVAPTNAGTYVVVGTITSANYQGSASALMVIDKATASISFNGWLAVYDGAPHPVTAITIPASLTINLTYNGSATPPTNAGNYTVEGTISDVNYQGSSAVGMLVEKVSGILAWDPPATIVYGTPLSAAQLNATSTVPGSFAYVPDLGQVLSVGTYTMRVTFTPSDTVNYYSATALRTLSVLPVAPVVTTQPVSQKVPLGYGVVFNVAASGKPDPTYQWQKNGVNIAGATSNIYSIVAVTANDQGSYRVIVTNSGGTVFSDTAVLTAISASDSAKASTSDFNGDGKSDLLWQNTSTGERSIWLMNGTTLTAGVSLGLSPTQWSIAAVADFNGDGKPDLLWQNALTGERTFWLMNGSTFASSADLGTYSTDLMIAGAGDFNGDGKPDLVWQNTSTGERSIWIMNGTTVDYVVDLGTLPPEWSIAGTGEFNGDGKCDLIWQNTVTGERAMWLMNGTMVTAGVALGVYPQLQISGTGDYNGDGKSDILWTNVSTGERIIWLMNGTTKASEVSLGVVSLNWVLNRPVFRRALADFNNDGKSDLVWQNTSTGDRAIWIMNGIEARTGLSLGNYAVDQWIAAVGDFNNDGKADLVWENRTTGVRSIALMNGTTVLSTVVLGTYDPAWKINTTGDFNADGKPDLVWTNTTTGARAIWLMDGTAFTAGADLGTVAAAQQVAGTGDFDGDGKTDIFWQNTTTGERTIWLMNGTTHTSAVTLGTYAPEWSIVGTGDYNADGKPDLLWQNTVTGERAIWLMNGTTFFSSSAVGTYGTAWSIRN